MAGAYSDLPPGGSDALAFYLQQGANIGGMAMRLMALQRPPGTTFLEVGCGFGLSLDFARRMLGWEVRGLDPSPFAREGREQLNLPIESRYLEANGLDRASADVIHASEFIEHIADPLSMLATLRKALRPGGTLLLTTPAAEMIRPDTGDGLLVPLLSAGWHLVIQTAESLAWILREAGFTTVSVIREGAQLVAVAGRLPEAILPDKTFRPQYQEWLRQLATSVPELSDLSFGVRARLYREMVIANLTESNQVWTSLNNLARKRYKLDLDSLATGSMGAPSLRELVLREPLGLAGILLARGWSRKRAAEQSEVYFEGAIAAASRLRAALQRVGVDDGDSEDVAFAAKAELILLSAERSEGGVATSLDSLRKAGGQRHADLIAPVCFINLVNQAAFDEAKMLAGLVQPALAKMSYSSVSGPLNKMDASLIYCLATLEIQSEGGDRTAAITWLQQLREQIVTSERFRRQNSIGSIRLKQLLWRFFRRRHFCEATDFTIGTDLYWPAVDAEMASLRLMGLEKLAKLVREDAVRAARQVGILA
jgi:2-polyprenyl-3-methyl-5-hydroxy-6-metoxy-1,4-benzoquinol methylase